MGLSRPHEREAPPQSSSGKFCCLLRLNEEKKISDFIGNIFKLLHFEKLLRVSSVHKTQRYSTCFQS